MSELPAPSGPGADASAPSPPTPASPAPVDTPRNGEASAAVGAAPSSSAGAQATAAEPDPSGAAKPTRRVSERTRAVSEGAGDGGPPSEGVSTSEGDAADGGDGSDSAGRSRSRSRRGGRGRGGSATAAAVTGPDADEPDDAEARSAGGRAAGGGEDAASRGAGGEPTSSGPFGDDRNPELPDRHIEGRPKSVEAAQRALVPRKPRIGDTMPAPVAPPPGVAAPAARSGAGSGGDAGPAGDDAGEDGAKGRSRRRGGRGRGSGRKGEARGEGAGQAGGSGAGSGSGSSGGGGRGGAGGGGRGGASRPVEQVLYDDEPLELDEKALTGRRGRERKGRPVGRYLMCVHVGPKATQIAVLEGRSLVEHYVSRPADDVTEIHGNIYLGKVQNVLPGMEAAFVDIGTPKNAVLYRGDVHYDKEDLEPDGKGGGGGHGHGSNANRPRIEQVLRARQTILCQVTKNPIAHKGARLTQEVSLPGRFVVLIPNSTTYGISKRLPDNERKRLRQILDRVKPPQHGVIVRTAAENVTEEEIERDVRRLADQWEKIDALSKRSTAPALLYREPDLALRVIREEFNAEYRKIIIDEPRLFEEVRSYVAAISPTLADRVEFFDPASEPLPLFEKHHIHEQRLRALDKKVWLPSGGSLIIEHTEALTVIDVNTGKNVGSSSLEETVFRNNLEAATEIARQLRLRDIGGIIVIDFVDMESKDNRDEVVRVFRDALARDKTRTQVFDISELGLVEMTRKRIGEGLIESVSHRCAICEGRGLTLDEELVGEHAP